MTVNQPGFKNTSAAISEGVGKMETDELGWWDRFLWKLVEAVENLEGATSLKKVVSRLVMHQVKKDFAFEVVSPCSLLQTDRVDRFELFKSFRVRPVMSILMPVYNTKPPALEKCLASVIAQVYKKWELCIVDDGSTGPHVRDILEGYARWEPRIRLVFSERNEGIVAATNKAASMASGLFLGVLDHDDELDRDTLLEYVRLINQRPKADCIYCDEDKIDDSGRYCDPWFKSGWNPDLSLSFNYVMHFAMYRKSLFDKLGGFRKPYEGSQDYDLLLRVSEETEEIHHIPKVLYHWRVGQASIASGPEAKPYVFESGLAALNDALKRRGIDGTAENAPDVWKGAYRVRRKINKEMRVSIIIAFSGNKTGLRRVLNSIFVHVPQENVEIQVCFHSASRLDKEEFAESYNRVRWEEFDGPYTLPRAFNLGLGQASGEAIFFLDESMELISAESYWCLLEHIQRKEVGAVGGKVYHFNGLVEHGGVILGPFNIVGYAHRATPDTPGYVGLKSMICNYSAVMGLGMMTRRQVLVDMGGFGEEFARGYWDVDYCLKLRELGYLVTYSPYARFRHHIPVKALEQMVVEPEATLFRSRWQDLIDADPYFNPNFSRDLEDFNIKKLGY